MLALFDQSSNYNVTLLPYKEKVNYYFICFLLKFLTIVRWMYKIPSERGYKSTIMNAPAHAWSDSLRKLQFSKLRPKNWLNLHTQSLGDQWLQFALASIFPLRWVVCCVFTDCGLYIINILNQRFYLATFVRFCMSSATFNTFSTIWNCATFNTGKDQKDNAWVVGYARLFWITNELRTQISGIC